MMGFEADVLTDLRETKKQPNLEVATGWASARRVTSGCSDTGLLVQMPRFARIDRVCLKY